MEPTQAVQLVEDAPFAAIGLDASLRIVGWNAAASRLFGAEAALGEDIAARIPGVDAAVWIELVATGTARSTLAGRAIEWTAVTSRATDGRLRGVSCYARDVGEAAVEVKRSLEEILLRAIVDNLDVVVWAMEPGGVCTYHQGKASASLGLQPGAFVGLNLRDMYGPQNTQGFDRVFAGELVFADGESHGQCFQNWMIPMRGPSGAVELLVALSLNVTEQKRGEQELRARLLQIEAQQRTIRELSTPIIEVWDRILTLPLLGMVDTDRASEIMESLLQAITAKRARFAILDLTGVQEIDTATAGHLLGLVRAIRLLGAEGVISGIHPNIAQTIVNLGVDLPSLIVHANLRGALGYCITRLR